MQLFEFADKFRGKYDDSIEVVKGYYPSLSGYKDELLWAALWLYKATGEMDYYNYVTENAHSFGGVGWAMTEFSWDVKYAGVQVMASMVNSCPKLFCTKCSLNFFTIYHSFPKCVVMSPSSCSRRLCLKKRSKYSISTVQKQSTTSVHALTKTKNIM